MNEAWKAVPGYEGRYEVSDQGRVRNNAGKVLKLNRMVHGYICAHLYDGTGKANRRVKTIHQLVARAFLPNLSNLREVNHRNFDKADNRVSNLEWVTRKENVRHAIVGGRRPKNGKQVCGICLETGEIVKFDNQIDAEIAVRGCQTGGISHALRLNRSAYGYVWWRE